jgi:hypothetical protein
MGPSGVPSGPLGGPFEALREHHQSPLGALMRLFGGSIRALRGPIEAIRGLIRAHRGPIQALWEP